MSQRLQILLVALLLTLTSIDTRCEPNTRAIGIALYDVGRLYDTIPSPFYNDSRYTPQGKMQWSDKRYRTKVKNIAKVIDSLQLPLVVLYGVESRDVVRDIQRQLSGDYSARHATIDYYDGLDFALLYYGDMLHINKIASHSHYAYFGGELMGHTIGIHLTRQGKKLRTILPPDGYELPDITIAWGRLNGDDMKRLEMDDPLRHAEQLGRGDTKSSRGWYLKNRIGIKLSEGLSIGDSGIYISRYLLTKSGDKPLATHSDRSYIGGYSSHLPQYIFIVVP